MTVYELWEGSTSAPFRLTETDYLGAGGDNPIREYMIYGRRVSEPYTMDGVSCKLNCDKGFYDPKALTISHNQYCQSMACKS